MKKLVALLSVVALLAGCTTLFNSIVTITEIRDSTMTKLAKLSAQGKIDAETDKKIAEADAAYLKAASACQQALIAYKSGTGTEANYIGTINAVKEGVKGLINILAPFVTQQETANVNAQLAKAVKL